MPKLPFLSALLQSDKSGPLHRLARTMTDDTAQFADPERLAEVGRTVMARLESTPGVERVICAGADLFTLPGFADPALCRKLVRAIDKEATPSTLFKGPNPDGFRTSFTHYFSMRDKQTAGIEARISELMGIDDAHSEMIQGQRYQVGQQYKPHHDYFHQGQAYWQQEAPRGGQRSWTAMLFLNTPEEGGETEFTKLGVAIPPVPGTLVIWNNMGRDGKPNDRTIHAGTPVLRGVKHVLTKWYRLDRWREINADKYR
ncbi:prolyl hydroxylase family protein [Novosphingobium sp. 9]|uniref:prolyl hydroxylase family protein n=1 Tax=Novosphingobium sp. 9 TaxID=2025349 RepID=UPI0021B5F61F|nr:2OG-Fe(II) oxygenase [Novosphingobium sp. 9]